MPRKIISPEILFNTTPRDPFADYPTQTMLEALRRANKRYTNTDMLDQLNQFFSERGVQVTSQGAISMHMGMPSSPVEAVLTFQSQTHAVLDIMWELVAATDAIVDHSEPTYGNVVKLSIAGQPCEFLCVWDYVVEERVNHQICAFVNPPVITGKAPGLSFMSDHFAQLRQLSDELIQSDHAYAAFFLTKMALPELSTTVVMWLVSVSTNNSAHAFSIMHHMLVTMKDVARTFSGVISILTYPQLRQIAASVPAYVAFLKELSLIDENGQPMPVSYHSPVSDRICSICIDLTELLASDVPASEFVAATRAIARVN